MIRVILCVTRDLSCYSIFSKNLDADKKIYCFKILNFRPNLLLMFNVV